MADDELERLDDKAWLTAEDIQVIIDARIKAVDARIKALEAEL